MVLDAAEAIIEFGELAEQFVFHPSQIGILPIRVSLDQSLELLSEVPKARIHVPEAGIHVGIVEHDANQHDDDRGYRHDGHRDVELGRVQASPILPSSARFERSLSENHGG